MPGREPPVSFLISAEHASNQVPKPWQHLFAGQRSVLDSHRGWDPGSGELARALAAALDAPLLEGRFTRLLIDLNRSAGHPRHFSEFTRGLPPAEKRELVERYWQPHWDCYGECLESLPGQIIHIACHSFSPVLDGRSRRTDIGLLYDPSRPLEAHYCRTLGTALREALPEFTIHMNQPYLGVSNGMGQQHRRLHDDRRLVTLELEINQRLVARPDWNFIRRSIAGSVRHHAA
ncbi:MAG: N-formylglutamate amidohydrolase [Wenzhouxiangellaceae bacterium]|nr:N-formylglutamate amidohydrolase [Wenzhouxiangellaceae bacterium]